MTGSGPGGGGPGSSGSGRSAAREALAGLTVRGRCLLAAGLTLTASAVGLGQRDLLRAGLLLLALPLVAAASVARTRYRLACHRSLTPRLVPVGGTAVASLVLENLSRLPSGMLLLEDALPWTLGSPARFVLDRVEPQGRRVVEHRLSCHTRGRYGVGPLHLRLTDPFGLVELTRAFTAVDHLVVPPAVTPLPGVRLSGDWSGGESPARVGAAAGSDDVATREYRYGDDLRRVHWRTTARRGELTVRSEERPQQSQAVLLLDGRAGAHRGQGASSSYEYAVSAVASIGVQLTKGGSGLRLLDHGGRELGPPGQPMTATVLLDTLADVTADRTTSLAPAVARLRAAPPGGALVAVLGLLEPADAQRLARLRPPGTTCVAVLLDVDSWTTAPRSREAALAAYQASAQLLAGTGWRVLRVEHGTPLAAVWPLAGRAPLPIGGRR